MEMKTYRAKSLHEALQRVRLELGPDAAVVQTRRLRGPLRWLTGRQEFEVTASADLQLPSRFAALPAAGAEKDATGIAARKAGKAVPAAHEEDFRGRFRDQVEEQDDRFPSVVETLSLSEGGDEPDVAGAFCCLLDELLAAEFHPQAAADLIERLQEVTGAGTPCSDLPHLRRRLGQLIEEDVPCNGPIRPTQGRPKVVALVGPTGVGKTTTIAKLAANFHLRDQFRVGLITVDTYRIAAVDQLRTYADIIDLPLEVVATPREMRAAVGRLQDQDLILIDTAGHSPQDELRLQELRAILAEARADEVHLVLSSVASPAGLRRAVQQFRPLGARALILTKLDEATGLGSLWPLLQEGELPLSYLTCGQNVPEDIEPAQRTRLVSTLLTPGATCLRGQRC